jgi:hypothetical protein
LNFSGSLGAPVPSLHNKFKLGKEKIVTDDPVLKVWNELPLKQRIDLANELDIHSLYVLMFNEKVRKIVLNLKPKKRRLLREED